MKLSKILSFVLAFVMIFSVLPMAVFAEDEELSVYDVVDSFPTRNNPYVRLYDEYSEGASYQWSASGEEIEGETTNTLTVSLDFCIQYICTITLSNGDVFEVDFDTFPYGYNNPGNYNRYFHVSDEDMVDSFQWYVDIVNDTAITDKNASNICSSCENSVYSSYDEATNLWSGSLVGGDGEGMYELFVFEVELNEGDVLLIDAGYEVEEIIISDSDNDIMDNPDYFMTGNIGVYQAPESDTFRVTFYTPDRTSTVEAFIRDYEMGVLLEEETEPGLNNAEIGNAYYCVATYNNGYELSSNKFVAAPYIQEEPNALNPSFGITDSEEATFQWYQVNDILTPVTDENASNVQYGRYKSSYNGADGVWNGLVVHLSEEWVDYVFFTVELNAGDVIRFKTDANLDGNAIVLSDYDMDYSQYVYREDGEYIAEIECTGTYTIMYGALNTEKAGTLYAELVDQQVTVLEDETSSTLSEVEFGQMYYCEASFPHCMVLKSEIFKSAPQIIEEPTSSKPIFSVSFEDYAEFQWFTATPDSYVIDDSMTDGKDGTYDPDTEQWTPTYEEGYDYGDYIESRMDLFVIFLEKGQTLKITISDTDAISPKDSEMRFAGYNYYSSQWSEDGVVMFTSPEDSYYDIYQYGVWGKTATFKVELFDYILEEIEGETENKLSVMENGGYYTATATYADGTILTSTVFEARPAIISQPTEKNPSVEVNIVEDDMQYQWYEAIIDDVTITDEDVIWTNDEFHAIYDSENESWTPTIYDTEELDDATIYELDLFIMSLEAGETIKFEFSEEILGNTIIAMQQHYSDDLQIQPDEDGIYTFIAPETQEYYFYFYALTSDITVKAARTSVVFGDAIEGENAKKLQSRKAGSYACVITYADGTELVSDAFSITTVAGDVNNDGIVNSLDYLLVKRACFGTYELTDDEKAIADVSGDGDVSSADYLLVKRIAFGTYTA